MVTTYPKQKLKEFMDEILSDPVVPELSEHAQKVRRNTILTGAISIFLGLAEVEICNNQMTFGLSISGISTYEFLWALWLINLYNIIHYITLVKNHFNEYRIKLTGGKEFGISHYDNLEDSDLTPADKVTSQITLLNFWRVQNGTFKEYYNINESICHLREQLEKMSHNVDVGIIMTQVEIIRNRHQEYLINIERLMRFLSSPRRISGLQRFDRAVKNFLRLQGYRYFIIEYGLPFFIGYAGSLVILVSINNLNL